MGAVIGGKTMAQMIIREDRCKGCGLCMTACPKKIIRFSDKLNLKGYKPAECFDQKKCIGCAMCALICPDVAITVTK